MSRKIAFSLVMIIFLTIFSVTGVFAEELTDAYGQWKYVLEDGKATIMGYVKEPRGDLIVPVELDGHSVTGIGYMAFEMCIDLTSVVIPDSVQRIGNAAFAYCENLTSVMIPESVTAIGDNAFYYCFGLTNVTIPDNVASIGDGAFMGCINLTSVTIPSSVTSIGDEVFSDCSSLIGVVIPDRVSSIGFGAFCGCTSLGSVTIPDSVTRIGSMAFAMCGGLTSVTIPASVTNIGDSAFDAPGSVYPVDETDDMVIYGSDKLILRVEKGSYAEQYAKENELRFTTDDMYTQPDALTDLTILEDWDTGIVLGAALTSEGMLLAGVYDYFWTDAGGWLAFFDKEGNESWSPDEGNELYLHPIPLANGGFAVLCEREFDEGMSVDCPSVSLMILSREGVVIANPPVPRYARDIVAVGDSIFVLGNQASEDSGGEGKPTIGESFLARFTTDGELLWKQNYTHPDYSVLRFQKAVYAEESLLIGANADVAESGLRVCALYRCDLDGNFIWEAEATPEIGKESSIIDLCVNDNGMIAMVCGEYAYDEEYGEPLDRMCDVFGLNMNGDVLWNYKMNGGMIDYILPVRGGFLCVSEGLDLYNCPYIGDGWVLLLDENGNVKAADSTPDIGGGKYEIYGMAKGVSGEAFLFGTLLDDPGFPGAPFVGRLDFPEVYD